jgi:Spy/CpxP family protein refolding chaperone
MLKTFSLITLLALGTPALASAQDKPVPPQRGRANRAADGVLTPNEVMNVLDGYALVQAQEALQLNEAQYGQFVTRLKKLQETRRKNLQARRRLLQELQRGTGPQATNVDEAAVRQQLKTLREHDERSAVEVQKAYDAVDEVLDARQQARFRVFEERLEMRKIDLLMRARQGAARR